MMKLTCRSRDRPNLDRKWRGPRRVQNTELPTMGGIGGSGSWSRSLALDVVGREGLEPPTPGLKARRAARQTVKIRGWRGPC